MVDLLSQWTLVLEEQRRALRIVDNCRVEKTRIIGELLRDGMTPEQIASFLDLAPATLVKLSDGLIPPRK